MKLKMKNDWTKEEIDILYDNYSKLGPNGVGKMLRLPKRTVQNKALSLNLKFVNKTIGDLRQDFIDKAINIHSDKYDYTKTIYVNCRTKVKIICKKHGEFEQYPTSHITHKQNCPICAKTSMTTEKLIDRFIKTHKDKYIYDKVEYTGKDCYVIIGCKTHGDFTQRYDSHAKGYGCNKCLNSLGENKIAEYLLENKIKFIPQKKFNECKYKKELPFDFYLLDYNICIEYNGLQHYKSIIYWGGDSEFKYRQIRDKLKVEYCFNNNIPLLIIKYNDDILQKLNNYLSNVVNSKPSLVLKKTIC